MCTKRLIASQLISCVEAHKNYDLDIYLNVSYSQFIGSDAGE